MALAIIVEALCLFEARFAPSFWDIMSHIVIHLVDKLSAYGLVLCRWMYPIERYLDVVKKYVHSRSLPRGSIKEGYILDKALGCA